MQHAKHTGWIFKNISKIPPKEREKMKELCKVKECCLFIFQQVKLIEDEWFSFLKFMGIHISFQIKIQVSHWLISNQSIA